MLKKYILAAAVAVGAVAAAGTAQACPNYSLRAAFGTINLPGGFLPDPYLRNVTAGGGYYLPNCGLNWGGWVAAAPDFQFTYGGGAASLTLAIISNADTVLLINDPNGQWFFSDDAPGFGLGAAVSFNRPIAGVYDIWIGTYNRASGIPAQLYISER
ncbi:MAG: peptidase S1 [Bauldia sp.]|nr:peptidase S1 [Bauldia sp.]